MNYLRETPEQAGLVLHERRSRDTAIFRDLDSGNLEHWERRPHGFAGYGLQYDGDVWEFCCGHCEKMRTAS